MGTHRLQAAEMLAGIGISSFPSDWQSCDEHDGQRFNGQTVAAERGATKLDIGQAASLNCMETQRAALRSAAFTLRLNVRGKGRLAACRKTSP
jgi:hypothetical protein